MMPQLHHRVVFGLFNHPVGQWNTHPVGQWNTIRKGIDLIQKMLLVGNSRTLDNVPFDQPPIAFKSLPTFQSWRWQLASKTHTHNQFGTKVAGGKKQLENARGRNGIDYIGLDYNIIICIRKTLAIVSVEVTFICHSNSI